jgi:hypothetical protein
MSEAARIQALNGYMPGYKMSVTETMAFDAGWKAAMRFMAQPRIPALTPTPVQPEPTPVAERFAHVACRQCHLTKGLKGTDLYPALWMTLNFADGRVTHYCCPTCLWDHMQRVNAALGEMAPEPKEHNPHGLVAFYTDAPDA